MEIPSNLRERAVRWPDLKRWERQELARDLRLLGLSYGEIRKLIPASKGSLIPWCRDIPLTPEQLERIRSIGGNSEVGRAKAGATLRQRNIERVAAIRAAALKEAESLMGDPFWMAGVVAYWAEGAKRDNQLLFANSDVDMVCLFINWGMKFFRLTTDRFSMRLHLHDGQDEDERQAFWSSATGIPIEQFRKGFVKPEGTGHRKNILYGGTAAIRVTRSTDLLHRLFGWTDAVRARHANPLDS